MIGRHLTNAIYLDNVNDVTAIAAMVNFMQITTNEPLVINLNANITTMDSYL